MHFLFIFLDGVGLGDDDPQKNPFAGADMPTLKNLLGGRRLLRDNSPFDGPRASLRALDPNLGVPGLPQSATGQAVLLTGQNVPAGLGYHYGPKPNPAVAELLRNGNLFSRLVKKGRRAALLSAYPPRYFEAISSGRRIYSAIPLAATSAGLSLRDIFDLEAGNALAADFTAQGWRDHLGMDEITVISPQSAGKRLAYLAKGYDFALFEYWLSDYAGHHQEMEPAIQLLEEFDQVLSGLLAEWDDRQGLVLVTSDHGNLEDISTRRHTTNPVPGLVIGAPEMRQTFLEGLVDLTGITPAILQMIR